MQSKEILNSIVNSKDQWEQQTILENLLPKRDAPYTLDEIDTVIGSCHEAIEDVERKNNDSFDIVLHKKNLDQLENLYRNLHNTQLDVMKLQCDIAFTKEQYDTVKSICNSPLIQERRDLLMKEENLRQFLQQLKFEPLKNFFEKFANYISSRVEMCQKMLSHQASNYMQTFPWAQYHQTIFLVRACGKAIIDVIKFEQLYQSNHDIGSLKFKQPIEQMDLNNFIEFQDAYSIESQLEVTTANNQKKDLKELLSSASCFTSPDSGTPINHYVVFKSVHENLNRTTMVCCKLLVDLNMDYIEAHLTDGINIDKLNGSDGATLLSPEEQTLPLYAFSPQEYITQIGQHLLTLRKQTEQFDSIDNESLKFALENLQVQNIKFDVKSCKTVTEIIMSCIARHCIGSLLGRTSHSILSQLTPNGRRQLATDALYLDNVLDDLGLLDPKDTNVVKFKSLLVQ